MNQQLRSFCAGCKVSKTRRNLRELDTPQPATTVAAGLMMTCGLCRPGALKSSPGKRKMRSTSTTLFGARTEADLARPPKSTKSMRSEECVKGTTAAGAGLPDRAVTRGATPICLCGKKPDQRRCSVRGCRLEAAVRCMQCKGAGHRHLLWHARTDAQPGLRQLDVPAWGGAHRLPSPRSGRVRGPGMRFGSSSDGMQESE